MQAAAKIKAAARVETTIKLILEIQKHSLLYDGSSATAMQRHHAWMQCAGATGFTVDYCRKLWKSLRDRFVKEVRRAENNLQTSKTPWVMLPYLKFLQNHIRDRRSTPGLDTLAQASSASGIALTPVEVEVHDQQSQQDGQGEVLHIPLNAMVQADQQQTQYQLNNTAPQTDGMYEERKRRWLESIPEVGAHSNEVAVKRYKMQTSTSSSQENTEDLDELFFMSLLPDIKRLPSKAKFQLKIKIMETVQDFLFQEDNKVTT